MRSAFRYGALFVALGASVGLAPAYVGLASAYESIGDDIVGTVGRAASEHALTLTDEQQGRIFFGVINLPDVPDESLAEAGAVAEVPASVALQDLPARVIREVPTVREYKFVKVEDYILVVNPVTRAVVAHIPRFKALQ